MLASSSPARETTTLSVSRGSVAYVCVRQRIRVQRYKEVFARERSSSSSTFGASFFSFAEARRLTRFRPPSYRGRERGVVRFAWWNAPERIMLIAGKNFVFNVKAVIIVFHAWNKSIECIAIERSDENATSSIDKYYYSLLFLTCL